MIARGVVCCVDGCQSEGVHAAAYRAANERVPKSSCLERLATIVACGVLSSSCSSLGGCISGESWADCFLGSSCIGILVVTSGGDECVDGRFSDNGFSTGCIRDCTVLQKTFANAQAVMANTIER